MEWKRLDIKRINALKKAQEKQDILEETLYKLKTSSKATVLRVEFEPDSYEFYGIEREGLEFEPCKQGLIIYLEHEIKHCELIKAEIVKELALEILPKLDTPETAYIETKAEMESAVTVEHVEPNKLIELKQVMENREQRYLSID